MRLEQQYRELLRLREEINIRLETGTDFQNIKELTLHLAGDQGYRKLKEEENQMIVLDRFLDIWLEEKRKLPGMGITGDVFSGIKSLEQLEQRYQGIKYCALRVENHVPEPYVRESVNWLMEEKISGIAIGKITILETRDREDNLLHIAQEFKRQGDLPGAILLLQYASGQYPGQERMILEEADCWMQGRQWQRAYELLAGMGKPTVEMEEIIRGLRQVMGNG